jgi:hypothetical protein
VPGGSNANNYANVPLIVDLALRTGAHAVWAGWGHASENPRLPTSLAAVGIAFLGPPASSMRDLGDKICSTILAQSARVSVVPWSGYTPPRTLCISHPPSRIPRVLSFFWTCVVATRFLFYQLLADARPHAQRRRGGAVWRDGNHRRAAEQGTGQVGRAGTRGAAAHRVPGHDQSLRGRRRQGHPQSHQGGRGRGRLPPGNHPKPPYAVPPASIQQQQQHTWTISLPRTHVACPTRACRWYRKSAGLQCS